MLNMFWHILAKKRGRGVRKLRVDPGCRDIVLWEKSAKLHVLWLLDLLLTMDSRALLDRKLCQMQHGETEELLGQVNNPSFLWVFACGAQVW